MKTDQPRAAWRRIALPLGALLLSMALLFTGLNALKAQAAPRESGRNAPLQQAVPYQFAISKSAFPDRFTVGSSNSYIIRVTNPITVPGHAHIITVQDDLPDGMTWTPPTSGLWNCRNSTTTQVNCIYSVFGAFFFDPLFVDVTVEPDIEAPNINAIPNTARLTVDPPEADPTNTTYPNQSTIFVEINSADLELSKTVFPTIADVGDTITYTLAITNNGPNTVNSFIVEDLDLRDSPLSYVGPGPNPDGTYDQSTGRWSYSNPLSLQVDEVVSTTLVFTIPTGVSGQLNNTARIISSLGLDGTARGDWVTANNTDSASLVVGGLEIFKTITVPNGSTDPITAIVGEPIEVGISVHNPTSISVTGGFTVTEQIPLGLDLRFPLPTGSFWDPTSRIYRFRRAATMVPGETFSFTFTLVGSSSINFQQEFTNVATVTWGDPPNSADSNEVTFTVFPGGALHVTKSDNRTQVYPGDTISYTIAVTNTGNVQVNQVVLTDTLGSQLFATGLALDNVAVGSCPNSGICRVTLNDPLSAGEKVTFRVGARVAPNAVPGTTVVNTILARGIDGESDAVVSSTASDTNTVLESPDTVMRIIKEVSPVQAAVGENFTFYIDVRNTGDTAVSSVRVTDKFEAILDLVSATTTRGTATLNTGARTLEVAVGTMNPNERVTIVVTTRVNSTVTAARVYRNVANLSWSPGNREITSGSVSFRALPSSALPGTGINAPLLGILIPPGSDPSQSAAGGFVSGALGMLAVGLGLLAALLLAYSLWARANRPLYAGRIARGGLALVVLALMCGVGALLLRPAPQQLASLAGNKPPLASAAPTQIPAPTATPRLPGPAKQQPGESSQPILETRPTEDLAAPTMEPLPAELAHLAPTPTPSVLPDFNIPTPTAMPAVGPDGGPPDPSAVTRIVIPAINLDTVVKYVPFSGSTWLIGGLKQEVAWMGDTSWPGLGSNTGLAGHVDLVDGSPGPFWNLKQLKAGDQVIIHTQQKVYTYRVREQRVVPDTEMTVVAPTDNAQITLITCTDWSGELRTYLQRLIVFAEFVQVQAQ